MKIEHKLLDSANDWARCTCGKLFGDDKTKTAKEKLEEHLGMKKERNTSMKQKIANAINPLKTGKNSRYFNPEIVRFIKDPTLLADVMMDSLRKLQQEDLDIKERILYTNTLTNVYKTIFGNKNLNLNVEIRPDSAKSMRKIYLEIKTEKEDARQTDTRTSDKRKERKISG